MANGSAGILPIIAVDRNASSPLHKQIYDGFRSAILRSELRPGQRIPSTRDLAVELHISRIPVLNAFAQLLAEGYFQSQSGVGTFVSHCLPDNLTSCQSGSLAVPAVSPGPRPIARQSLLLQGYEVNPWVRGFGAFALHQPAFDEFPFQTWSQLVVRHSRSPRINALHHIDPLGSEKFRQAISSYLRTARAVRCDPQQIMIVSGSQQALAISARVLLDPGNNVWVEEPSYWLAKNIFRGAGCHLIPVPLDAQGMDVAAGMKRCRGARAVYVTPSHQFPLGMTMSAARRLQLLAWAESTGSWIIEDDYDSEYRYASMPIASLQGLDRNSRVIYIGTFSKVLFPSLRLGYIVIPPDLVDRFMAVRFAMDIFPPYLYQEVLTDFMEEGHFGRHIRRMRQLYRERRSALVESICNEFGPTLEMHGTEAGMHLAVTLPDGYADREIAINAARDKLWLWPLSSSYMGENPRQGFILGFGSTTPTEMPRAVRRLHTAIYGKK